MLVTYEVRRRRRRRRKGENPGLPVYGTVGFSWLDAVLQRTLGGVGMSRQRLPVEKECQCPAELILAGRKEKCGKRGREGGDEKMAKEGLRVWAEMERVALGKKSSSHSL